MNGAMQKGKRINTLLRYREVMREFEKHDIRVIPIAVVHRKFINPKFHISRDTLYRILNTPVEEELKVLQV